MKSTRGFTLIELLVVIAIIGILMALLFPAVNGALDAAKKAQAKNDVTQIATAVIAYETEYGRLPGSNGNGAVVNGANLLNALTNTTASGNTANPRGILFIETQVAKKGKSGISNGTWVDPWGKPYYVSLDGDYDNRVMVSTNGGTSGGTEITKKVGVWNESAVVRRQVRSWE